MHRPILKHLFPTLALLAAVVSASAALVDTDGNPATNDTYLGDLDMAVGTVGDLSTFVSTGAVEQAVSEANAYTDTKTATKQDKLPYPTNAIPYAAVSGTPTNVSAFNNDAGYVTKSVTNGLLSTSTAAATYQPKGNYLTSESDPVWESEKIEILDQLDAATETNALQTAQMASLFNVNTYYIVGQIVIRNGILYRCVTAHSGAWNPSHFAETSLGDEVSGLSSDVADLSSEVSGKLDASDVVPLGDGASTGQAADAADTSEAVSVLNSNVYYLQQDVESLQGEMETAVGDISYLYEQGLPKKLDADATGAIEWTENHNAFSVGDKVWFDGLLYEATEVVPASDKTNPPNNSKFKAIYIFEKIAEVADNVTTGKVSTAAVDGWYQDFSPTQQYYAGGDTVGYKGVLYKCTVNHLGEWDETHFEKLPILTRANVQPVTSGAHYDYEPASAGDTYRALQSLSGDIAAAAQAATNYTDTVAEELSRRLDDPKNYVISPLANYYYAGSGSIPGGYFFRSTTGTGMMGYAAKVPTPYGHIVVTGDSDDPVIAKFGSSYKIGQPADAVTGLSGFVENGVYAGANLRYNLQTTLGLEAYFTANMAVSSASMNNIAFAPPSGSLDFNTPDGKEHYIYSIYQYSGTATSVTYQYSDDIYDPDAGTWDSTSRLITFTYETTADTDWGYAAFGGTALATLENIDTARSELKERFGRYGELGTGWGYKIYDFTHDERKWELKVPRLTVASGATSDTPPWSGGNMWKTYDSLGIAKPADATRDNVQIIGWLTSGVPTEFATYLKKVVHTEGKYSSDGCKTVDYHIGLIPKNPYASTYESIDDFWVGVHVTNVTIAASGQPYCWGGVYFDNLYPDDVSELAGEVKDAVVSWDSVGTNWWYKSGNQNYAHITCSYNNQVYTNDCPFVFHSTATHIKPTVTISGYTATITITWQVDMVVEIPYLKTDCTWGVVPNGYNVRSGSTTHTFTLRTAQSLETLTEHANTVITDYNQHMFYDEGLKCTWQLCVTNGIFYTRKVSNQDYREKEFVE